MKNLLSDYVKLYPGTVSADLCRRTIEDLTRNGEWEQHEWQAYIGGEGHILNGDNEPGTTTYVTNTNYEIIESLRDALMSYFIDIDCSWFGSWQGYSPPKYMRYEVGDFMSKHYDHIYELYGSGAPVLSIIGSLNSDYEGGELVLFDDTRYHLRQGDVIIFPSTFLYPHQVYPVTKGVRHSFVSWTN